jgi:glycosyltransferase involved in cell wall biosynthesis
VSAFWKALIVVTIGCLDGLVWIGRRVKRRPRDLPHEDIRVLLTGTFYTDNWLAVHLKPLAAADRTGTITMVAASKVPEIDGVEAVYPSARMTRVLGRTGARLATFAVTAFRLRPHVVGGFHLLLNGLIARALAALTGCRSLYICGGGWREVEGGGYRTQNRLFNRLGRPSDFIERRLVAAVVDIDYVVTMGESVRHRFEELGAAGSVVVNPGGFDAKTYRPRESGIQPEFDLVTVGRLSGVKRVDLLIDAIAVARDRGEALSAAIVGDGPLSGALRDRVAAAELDDCITFAGWQDDVAFWLRQSRVFTLTSESEGLSQAMVQGMLCGLPAVVSDVGDLRDIVTSGDNGLLVESLEPSSFADAFHAVLSDSSTYARMSLNARLSAENLVVDAAAGRWDSLFSLSRTHDV